MTYQYLLVEQHDGTQVIKLNDPENMNAVHGELKAELVTELRRAEADPSVRVIIITGEGRAFCVGGNVKSFAQAGGRAQDVPLTPYQKLIPYASGTPGSTPEMIYTIWRLTKPTIAAINGACAATGLGIALACDMRVASERAKLAWGFPQRGLVPHDGTLYLIPQLIGWDAAFRLASTGRPLKAHEALDLRLVGQTTPPEHLMSTCLDLAEEIARNTPPVTLQLLKATMQEPLRQYMERAMIMGEQAEMVALSTEDHVEAVRSFAEKRPPVWKGK